MEYIAIITVLVISTINTLLAFYANKKSSEKVHSKVAKYRIDFENAMRSIDGNFDNANERLNKIEERNEAEDERRKKMFTFLENSKPSVFVQEKKKVSSKTRKKISESVKKNWEKRKRIAKKSNKK